MTQTASPPTAMADPAPTTGTVQQRDRTPTTPGATPSAIPKRAQIGIGAIAVTGAVLSFSSLRELAVTTGTSENIAWLFPITLDAAAGVAMFVWMRGTERHVVSYAKFLTWAFAITSIICNSANHGFKALIEHPEWYLLVASIVVGAIPPIVFVTIVHVVFLARQPERWGGPEAVTATSEPAATEVPSDEPDETPEPATEPIGTHPVPEATTEVVEPVPPVAPKPLRRRCESATCQKLLEPGSRIDRKFCNAACRQAAARERKAVTA